MIPQLNIKDFDYDLPEDRIAFFPVNERDQSKLLIFNGKKSIEQDKFSNISHYLSNQALLVFNNTRVIHARFIFENSTGSKIEVFCLKPVNPTAYENALKSTDECSWECMIGNLRKWKNTPLRHTIIKGNKVPQLTATRLSRTDNGFIVKFSWDDKTMTFGEIMDKVGLVPLPPYIKRQPVRSDSEWYQTVYASHDGSVAAPTAGLHFTDAVLKQFSSNNIRQVDITLHVGAGTFLPVKSNLITDHAMHAEQFSVSRTTLEILLNHSGPIIAIGTTTLRTLESIFWLGKKTKGLPSGVELFLDQWEPYEHCGTITVRESLESLLTLLIQNHLTELTATTRIMIVPGYKFRLVDQLVTNFHQPRSTLLLLVAAFIGEGWKNVYAYALANDFRFLSYGDSSLLIP